MKKVLREMQTLRAGCSKAGPKILPSCSPLRRPESALAVVRRRQKFCPTTDPIPRGCGTAKI